MPRPRRCTTGGWGGQEAVSYIGGDFYVDRFLRFFNYYTGGAGEWERGGRRRGGDTEPWIDHERGREDVARTGDRGERREFICSKR